MRISSSKKILNIIKISNITDETVNNIKIRIISKHLSTILKEVADIEGFSLISGARNYAVCDFNSIPPNGIRYIIAESRGLPISLNEITVETPFTMKFRVFTLQKIFGYALLFTTYVAFMTFIQTNA